MKKIVFVILLFALSAQASSSFIINNNLKLNMEDDIINSFPEENKLSYEIKYEDIGNEIIDLSKKTTYLLLGNNNNESIKDFYLRHNEFLSLRYNPEIPKINGDYDYDSKEYKDDLVSGYNIPTMFNKLNEMDICYTSFGNIRVSKTDDMILSIVTLPNVRMKRENIDNRMEYVYVNTNLILYYFYKPLNNEYKLYYIVGEITDSIEEYLDNVKNNNNAIAPQYDSSINNIYNSQKLNNISDNDLNTIYKNNKKNLVTILSYYNDNGSSFMANGFFIDKGLVITTWDFLLRSLRNGESLTVISDNKSYEVEGIVTVNKLSNIAILKLYEEVDHKVTLSSDINVGNPVIAISNNDVSYAINKGLLVSNNDYYQSTIPLSMSDEGSPIFNTNGEVVGMNTSILINSPTSLQVPYEALLEVQDKYKNMSFDDIKVLSFDELKKHFYVNYGKEKEVNDISSDRWQEINDITSISLNIHLKLIKANSDGNMISLRYYNPLSSYVDTIKMSLSFRNNLINKGFIEKLSSNNKYIYVKDNYQIIIMEEFDYLIIMMVI